MARIALRVSARLHRTRFGCGIRVYRLTEVEHFIVTDLIALKGFEDVPVLVIGIAAGVMFLCGVLGVLVNALDRYHCLEVVGVCKKSKGMTGQHKAIKE